MSIKNLKFHFQEIFLLHVILNRHISEFDNKIELIIAAFQLCANKK